MRIYLKAGLLVLTAFLFSCQPILKKSGLTPAPKIRVLLASISQKDSIFFNDKYLLHSEEAQYEFGKKNKKIYLTISRFGYKIFNANRLLTFSAQEIIRFKPLSRDASFRFQGNEYYGEIIIAAQDQNTLQIINRLDLERYLQGVVPAEIPTSQKEYLNAVKAQAICARTYALKKIEHQSDRLFDVYDDQRDQVYKGGNVHNPLSDQALRQTRGDVLMYKDSLADVFYHSTCGGITENASDVFSGLARPYLISAKDLIGQEFACTISPKFRWRRTFTLPQIDSLFKEIKNISLLNQTVKDTTQLELRAQVLQRSASGRVQKMQIIYGDSSLMLQEYDIRKFFKDRNGRTLPSTLFYIENPSDSLMVIKGGGYGHGIGMCQWGAVNMSVKGFKYYDILVNKYFPGTILKKAY